MKLADQLHCTGCGACMKACPKGAIHMQEDAAGFPTPQIDEKSCVDCGLCSKVCPALNPPEQQATRAAYAAQLRDEEALLDSTSGGIFTALSREVFSRGGVVYGCVWDDEYNAVVQVAESEAQIAPMRGSKYVWSWAADCFQDVKKRLEAGQAVLFTGLPCQVAGLKNYLRRDYENLYLLDFLCSGSPSPLALKAYLKTICKPPMPLKELKLKFRDKNPYGVGVHITYTGKKGHVVKGEHIRNPYYYSFYTKLIDRESCYQCPYGTDRRIADLTMGDYWGVSRYHADMNIRAGVSALLVNTEKGEKLLAAVQSRLELKQTRIESIAAANNLACNGKKREIHRPAKREAFFQELRQNGWDSAERKYLNDAGRLKRLVLLLLPAKTIGRLKQLKKKLVNQ